jgi:hypothetical protein
MLAGTAADFKHTTRSSESIAQDGENGFAVALARGGELLGHEVDATGKMNG